MRGWRLRHSGYVVLNVAKQFACLSHPFGLHTGIHTLNAAWHTVRLRVAIHWRLAIQNVHSHQDAHASADCFIVQTHARPHTHTHTHITYAM